MFALVCDQCIQIIKLDQRTLTLGSELFHCKAYLQFNLTKQENMLVFVSTETTESKPVKLEMETSYTEMLPHMVIFFS